MLGVEISTSRFEGVTTRQNLLGPHRFDVVGRPPIAGRVGEVCAVVGEHDLDPVGNSTGESFEGVASHTAGCRLMQLDESELGRPVDGDEQVALAFLCSDFGNVDVEVADRVTFELGTLGLLVIRFS